MTHTIVKRTTLCIFHHQTNLQNKTSEVKWRRGGGEEGRRGGGEEGRRGGGEEGRGETETEIRFLITLHFVFVAEKSRTPIYARISQTKQSNV